jgi:Na+/melibiose symporter-like transporter
MAAGGTGGFGVLRHRDFRLLWCGLVVSAVGTWMQIVAQALLVLDLSHGSALALGCVSLAQAAAFLAFALFGGAVADRVDKRRLLIFTQTLSLVFAVLLGVLTALHLVTVWMVVVLAFCQGAALSFDQPARAALVPELVPKDELFNAVSLQSIVFTGASTVGPALAGLSLAAIGYAGISNKGLRPHCRALMLDHEASSVTINCVVTTQADMNIIEVGRSSAPRPDTLGKRIRHSPVGDCQKRAAMPGRSRSADCTETASMFPGASMVACVSPAGTLF